MSAIVGLPMGSDADAELDFWGNFYEGNVSGGCQWTSLGNFSGEG